MIISRTVHVLSERHAARMWSRHGKWARTNSNAPLTLSDADVVYTDLHDSDLTRTNLHGAERLSFLI
ncbi:pentapeptide repeat-containing protein [Rhodococcus erythropolis]|uniref:pentapeptide repeat-containing protein n=1 Tax=Rhodococcus erythropolis TaxID=1833 RepID=UPI002949BF95|nr:pentapeptide repeat-containing protein [Rhodococcus erythropolis]MDV6278441.1 pentapeptide repeat-containing protein [Rhodococcus erythropolis]